MTPRVISIAAALLLAVAATASNQVAGADPPRGVLAQFTAGDLPVVGQQAAAPVSAPSKSEVVSVSAEFRAAAGGSSGRLLITAKMADGWHIYSTTQDPGGPVRTTIKLDPSSDYRLTGELEAETPPDAKLSDVFGGLVVEEHAGEVVWSAPLEMTAGVDPARLNISGTVTAQACNDAGVCYPPAALTFVATRVASANENLGVYQVANSHTTIRGHLSPAAATPGSKVTLTLSASPAPGWHVYARGEERNPLGSQPTMISVANQGGWPMTRPATDVPVIEKPSTLNEGEVERYHEQPATWTVEIDVPADAAPGEYAVTGLIGYQSCNEQGCDPPNAARFSAYLPVTDAAIAGELPLTFAAATYKEAADAAERAAKTAAATALNPTTLALQLASALAAGFILNFMPCVLPVIGLKIMSFVNQAGESRGRVFMLNLWYVTGLIFVFMLLATLALAAGQGWGAQFESIVFTVILAAIVFVFALSFLGVWEIPIPGFMGTGKANELAAQEGPAGAFFKGMLTTVLATPCTGPLLIPVLTWGMSQPAVVTYAVFGCIGLGMASPYLVIGAFPKLVSFLPKPGAWMETFKQAMGFVLLGTVVWLFYSMRSTPEFFVPTLAFLFGLWAACWWIGRTPLTAHMGAKLKAWGAAGVFAALIGWLAFGLEGAQLPWQPFTRVVLEEHRANGATVLVDFTADW